MRSWAAWLAFVPVELVVRERQEAYYEALRQSDQHADATLPCTLALNMRMPLPNATFLVFTGTPLIVGEEKIREPNSPFDADHWPDLCKIDFEKLAEKFKTGRRHTLNEKLKGTVAQKLMVLVRQNRTRMD
jgi:hypothetical protein